MEEIGKIQIEEIPNGDTITRLIDFPHKYNDVRGLIFERAFEFSKGRPESVNWAKYLAPPEQVHQRGCEFAAEKRNRRPEIDTRYVGYIATVVGDVRKFISQRGHGFFVTHEPSEGVHHVHISYAINPEVQGLKPNDKTELKYALQKTFGELVPHSCPA
jgi:hypothetical protein